MPYFNFCFAQLEDTIMADNELSEQISLLLLTLNQEILDSTVREIENSRNAIEQVRR